MEKKFIWKCADPFSKVEEKEVVVSLNKTEEEWRKFFKVFIMP